MSEEIIREATRLRDEYATMYTSTVSVECVINLLFTHTYLYTYREALSVIGTLYLLGLISKQLHDDLAKALIAVY